MLLKEGDGAFFSVGSSPPTPSPLFLAGRALIWSKHLQIRKKHKKMSGIGGAKSSSNAINSNPEVNKVRQLIESNSSADGWEKSWAQGLSPWDLGQPTPVILHLNRIGALPKGRALVPGCGSGQDVVAMACPERYVVGLDISESAIRKAVELSSTSPAIKYCTFVEEDFFTWRPIELFDLIYDYTFFCAIGLELRPAWAKKIEELLKPDGELITLMFPISDHVGGPPYKVSVSDYQELLHPLGFRAISIVDNELAIGPRKGREKLGRWRRPVSRSSSSL